MTAPAPGPPADSPQRFLRALFDSAVDAVSPGRVLPPLLPEPPKGRTVVLAVGKAAAAMADVVASNWDGPLSGLAVTRYGHAPGKLARHRNVQLIEAGHPVPDERSVAGARRALELAQGLGADDLALVLVSGGGSALWCLPVEGLALGDKQRITSALLHCGASIGEINAVRRSLSRIKGGRLAEAALPGRVETLLISDVVGDDPATIASGPSIPQPVDGERALEILRRYRIDLPPEVAAAVGARPLQPAGMKHGRNRWRIAASGRDALAAAERAALASGFEVVMLGDAIEGDARAAAREHAAAARGIARSGIPTVLLSGGEVTVTVPDGHGRGGPNTHFLLQLALDLDGMNGIHALACDTDGYDGDGDHAGAVISPSTLERARLAGVDAQHALDTCDSYRLFEAIGDLVVTGPTHTNVSDFRAVLVAGAASRPPG